MAMTPNDQDASGTANNSPLLTAQFIAASTIYGTDDPAVVLDALIAFLDRRYARAELGLVDATLTPPQVRIIASYNEGERVHPDDALRPLTDFPAHETLDAVETLHIPDAESDPFLTDEERAALKAQGITAYLIAPLTLGDRLIGIAAFSAPQATTIDADQLRGLRSLADQAAIIFENRSLLQRTESSLEEVRLLYEVNRALLQTTTVPEMLKALKTILATSASRIIHAEVSPDPNSSADEIIIRHVIDAEKGAQTTHIPVTAARRAVDLFDNPDDTQVIFVESLENAQNNILIDAFIRAQAKSYAAILVRDRGEIRDIIAIAYDRPRTFDARAHRLLTAVADQIATVLQNQRLFQQTQATAKQLDQQVRVLQTLNQLAMGATQFRSETELLNYTLEGLCGAVGADQVGIVTIDPDGRTGTVIAEYSRDRIVTVGQSIAVADNPVYVTLFDDVEAIFNIADTEIDPRIDMLTRQTLRISGIRSLLILGLRVGGRLIGSVDIGRYSPDRPFASDTIANAQTIVAQLSIAIENIRLFNATQQRADQLQRIAAFGQVVQGSLQLPTILDAMLTQTLELLPTDRISITLYDQRIGQLRIVAQYEEGKRSVDPQRGPLMTMTGSLAGQVWERGELLVIHDTQSLQNVRRTQDLSVRSLLIAPVRARGQTLGTVNLGSMTPNIYSDADIAIFQQIIAQFAVAVENGIVYAETERQARNEALINEISIKFQGYNDVEIMVNTLLESLGDAIDARRGRIRFNSADAPMVEDT